MKKTNFLMFFLIFLLAVATPLNSIVAASADQSEGQEAVLVDEAEAEAEVEVYETMKDESPATKLPNNTDVILLEEEETFSLIRYEVEGNIEEGFVKNEFIVIEVDTVDTENDESVPENKAMDSEAIDQGEEVADENSAETNDEAKSEAKSNDIDENEKSNRSSEEIQSEDSEESQVVEKEQKSVTLSAKDKELKKVSGIALKKPTYVYQSESRNSKQLKSYPKSTVLKFKLTSEKWYEASVKVGDEWKKGFINAEDVDHSQEVKNLQGYAAKEPTNVYSTPADQSSVANAEVLKTYPAGAKLKYRSYSDNWYIATVYVNGRANTGYISKSDVEENLPTLQAYAQQTKTNVYASASKKSNVLKSYLQGHLLEFKPYNNAWYEARVKVGSNWETGYIAKSDVGSEQPELRGYAQLEDTPVYGGMSKGSKVLKRYAAGHLLHYEAHKGNWYKARVKVGNSWEEGYIHKADVGDKFPKLQAYAQQTKTKVYASASKDSKVLKSYLQGHSLQFKPYNNAWYEARVKVGSDWETGYIAKSDVGSEQPELRGYAQQKNTPVYASQSKTSSVLKSYPVGSLLQYEAHRGDWYKARVKVGGAWKQGYIHKGDVGGKRPTLTGYAQNEATVVYASTSKYSNALKSYGAGSLLQFKPYNNNWYEARVKVGSSWKIGYIHADHVADSMPELTGFANKNRTAVYSSTSRNSSVWKTYKQGHLLKYEPYNNSWYKARVKVGSAWKTGFIHKDDVVQPLGKTVVIDAGHGGRDPGTSGNGVLEKDLTLELSLKTAKQLEQSGFNVIMPRTTDEYVALHERTNLANNSKSQLFLSVHANSGGGKGIETWWYSKGKKPAASKQFAQDIQSEVIKETNATNRGTKDGNLHVNRESNMPSALVEVGFVDNKTDAANMKKDSYKNSLVTGFVKGIKKYFNLPF